MPSRRGLLGGIATLSTALAAGAASGITETDTQESEEHGHDHEAGTADSDVVYVRNVEEVRGHLTSAATLLAEGRREDAVLHARHGSDYFTAVLPPVRDENPSLASRLRGRLGTVSDRIETADADGFERFVTREVLPLLDEAVETVVPEAVRETTAFDAEVANALAGRIAEEYAAAVTPAGEIDLSGEYWDARGFLTRLEARHNGIESALGTVPRQALETLHREMMGVAPPSAVVDATLRFRVAVAADADLSAASVEGVDAAVAYARNADEVRGHALASVQLSEYGDAGAAALHAGHGADYVLALAPPVHAEDPALAARLQERLLALDDRVDDASASEFERFVTEEVVPVVDEAVATVLSADRRESTAFSARVTVALLRRIEDEYDAAVTDEETIELYGEYWDARGFFRRVRARYDAMRSDLDSETRELVEPELDILAEELRTAAPPWDVANSIDPLVDDLSRAIDG
jgi:hypothetical protein